MKTLRELLELEDPKPEYKLYCDMDGVLTDFDGRFEHFAGMNPEEYEERYGTRAFWTLIDEKVGIKFWSDMEWTTEGRKLWDFIKEYEPTLLTSPSWQQESRLGKKMWVKNNLEPKPKVVFKYSKEKHVRARSNTIHIDDREDIIERWNEKGGIGILCPKNGSVKEVINQLKKLGYGR